MLERIIDRIQRGWRLAKAACRVLINEKKLLVFPLLSSLALLLVTMTFAVPLLTSRVFGWIMNFQDAPEMRFAGQVPYYLLLFGFYFCNYFVILFFNSALVACVILHFNGEEPTVGDGFQAAFSRLPQIFLWALIAATVGLALKILAERSGKIGRIIAAIIGIAWGIMTFFVIPVLVVEKVGPFKAIKRSLKIMSKTWGEGLVANFGVGLIMFVLFLVSLIPYIIGTMVGGWGILVGLVITVLLNLLLSLVASALNAIVVAALYQYAAKKRIPKEFKGGTLRNAFAMR